MYVDDQRSVSVPEVGDSSADQYVVELFEASDKSIPTAWGQRSVSVPDVGDSSTDDYLIELFKASDAG